MLSLEFSEALIVGSTVQGVGEHGLVVDLGAVLVDAKAESIEKIAKRGQVHVQV